MRVNHLRFAIALTVLLVLAGFVACGAENRVAPAAEGQDLARCQSINELMPSFQSALRTGGTENLRELIEDTLSVSPREGVPPPISDVLRAIFQKLTQYAKKPPEPGATGGELCASVANAPPLAQANELCEMRRSLQTLVHEGNAIDAVKLVQPALSTVLAYITGEGADCRGRPRVAHYEVATLLAGLCAQDGNCQASDTLELVVAFTAYANTAEGRKLFVDLDTLLNKPSVAALLDGATTTLTEDAYVGLFRVVLPVVISADGPQLRQTIEQLPLSDEVKADLQPVVDDLVLLLGHEELTGPMKKALNCYLVKDTNFDAIRLGYRLAIEEGCEPLGLRPLIASLLQLQAVDERGSFVWVVGRLAQAERDDEFAVDSTAAVCRTLFSTRRDANASRSNAELALPDIERLVRAGVIDEAICTVDTLLFGCAGADRPACR